MRTLAITASLLAVLVTLAWVVYKPAFDSAAAFIAAIAALASSLVVGRKQKETGQSLMVSGASVGIQAGRDASVRDIKNP